MRIAGVGSAFPGSYYGQEEICDQVVRLIAGSESIASKITDFARGVAVEGRHLALALEDYASLDGFGAANAAWIESAKQCGAEAARIALRASGIDPQRVGALFFTTITGIAAPSIDSYLIAPLELPLDVKRVPLFGLGCVAGVAGVARAADYVQAFPDESALLVAVELCSLNFQRHNVRPANLIAASLFGDGAAAVVVAPDDECGPCVRATRSRFYPDTADVMGWEVTDRGFEIVLSARVPEMVRRYLPEDVDAFLGEQGLTRGDIAAWICHPGGPRVLEAYEEALALPGGALEHAWESLRRNGNLSSASIIDVLARTLADNVPMPGQHALMIAMGPGFCSELVLLDF